MQIYGIITASKPLELMMLAPNMLLTFRFAIVILVSQFCGLALDPLFTAKWKVFRSLQALSCFILFPRKKTTPGCGDQIRLTTGRLLPNLFDHRAALPWFVWSCSGIAEWRPSFGIWVKIATDVYLCICTCVHVRVNVFRYVCICVLYIIGIYSTVHSLLDLVPPGGSFFFVCVYFCLRPCTHLH